VGFWRGPATDELKRRFSRIVMRSVLRGLHSRETHAPHSLENLVVSLSEQQHAFGMKPRKVEASF
jgi:hypothetical protein